MIVRTDRCTVAVVGDLFESEDDEDVWRSFSRSPEVQEASRKSVLELADFIVPGHGDRFAVSES